MNSATILRLPAVMSMVGLKRSAIYENIKAGNFPKPVKLGSRASGWVAGEVQEWITRRMNARSAG